MGLGSQTMPSLHCHYLKASQRRSLSASVCIVKHYSYQHAGFENPSSWTIITSMDDWSEGKDSKAGDPGIIQYGPTLVTTKTPRNRKMGWTFPSKDLREIVNGWSSFNRTFVTPVLQGLLHDTQSLEESQGPHALALAAEANQLDLCQSPSWPSHLPEHVPTHAICHSATSQQPMCAMCQRKQTAYICTLHIWNLRGVDPGWNTCFQLNQSVLEEHNSKIFKVSTAWFNELATSCNYFIGDSSCEPNGSGWTQVYLTDPYTTHIRGEQNSVSTPLGRLAVRKRSQIPGEEPHAGFNKFHSDRIGLIPLECGLSVPKAKVFALRDSTRSS